jgi:hypothetical protein
MLNNKLGIFNRLLSKQKINRQHAKYNSYRNRENNNFHLQIFHKFNVKETRESGYAMCRLSQNFLSI